MSSFFGLSVALSSLYAQQRGLEVTGHNVANANTEGYSRQRVALEALGGNAVPAVHATWRGAGAGVRVQGVDRLRDQFLEVRAQLEHGSDRSLRRTQALLARVELALGEPGTNGIQAQLADLWAGWDDVANRPEDLAARTQLLERATTLGSGLNRAAADVGDLWDASVEHLQIETVQVNAVATRVAELNGAIQRAVNGGLSADDLADQRDLLVMRLAEALGATVRPAEAGTVDVFVGGSALVRGARAEAVELAVPVGADVLTAPSTPVQLRWVKDGYRVTVTSGEVGGLLDGVNRLVPQQRGAIDAVAQTLVQQVNDQHVAGVDLDGAAGQPLLAWTAATGVRVLVSDPRALAAADPAGGTLDGSNANALAELAGREDGPDAAYRSYVVGLGVAAQVANRRVEIQAAITAQVDGAREAEAGVSIDEEMTNMIAFQRAYEAAARFLTTVDDALDTLINRTGLVGR